MALNILKFLPLIAVIALAGCAGGPTDDSDRWDEIQLYQEAKGAMNRGEFDTAIRQLETLEARYPFGDYSLQGQLDLMYAYLRAGSPDDTITTAQRFIRLNPTHERVDYVHYLQGIADFERNKSLLEGWFPRDPAKYDQGVLQRAFNAFNEVVTRYPDSPYAADARQRMIYLRNKMAQNCMENADWYVRREAWLSAAQRAQQCIQHFNGAPAVEQALKIMAKSYRKLGFDDLADVAQKAAK